MTENLAFEGQREDEQLKTIFRRHFVVFLPLLLPFLIAVQILLMIEYFHFGKIAFYADLAFCLISLLFFVYKLMLWYFSFFILTDQRLRCVQRNGVFSQAIFDIHLKSVTNTQYSENGLLSFLYGYGDIKIEFNSGELIIDRVANSTEVYNILQDLTNEVK